MSENRERMLTGIKPTGMPHIGNYFGAIKPAVNYSNQNEGEFFYFIADYHAITSEKDPKKFKESVYSVAASWIACGLNPEKAVLYKQSDIPEVFELTWILSCYTPKGDMNRAHAYKALVQENEEKGQKDLDHGVNMGLYTYPLLMAADILIVDSEKVPVGKDQIQHIEICRSIAKRINQYHGDVLVPPMEVIQKDVAVIPGLDGRKMSKSYGNTIPLFTTEKKLRKLVNRLKTDSTGPDEPKNPDDSLIYDFYALFANKDQLATFREDLIKGISWGEAKAQLFEIMNEELKGPREIYNDLMENPQKIDQILEAGKEKVRETARSTLNRVRKKLMIDS